MKESSLGSGGEGASAGGIHDSSPATQLDPKQKEVDIYRDTPVRLLGYANEVGEAFRSLVHVNFVRLSYVVASSYVLADTFDKGSKIYRLPWKSVETRRTKVACTALDTVVWQALASVIVPGFTINRLCHFSGLLLQRTTNLPIPIRKWTTTAIGLGAIPFIVHPIDSSIHFLMDKSLRQAYHIEALQDDLFPKDEQ